MAQKPTCQITQAPLINSDTINKGHNLKILGGATFFSRGSTFLRP